MKEARFSGGALGRLQLSDIRLKRFDDGSRGSATPSRSARRSRHCETILRNSGSLCMRLSASAASCSDRWPSTYFLPGEDNQVLAMHSTVSLSRVLALERGRQ